jgi:homogentisate 1,2-dioxygenase
VPFYQRLGDVPRKRHTQFRDNGTLLTEEVMGMEGFVGMESILYHLQSPCRVMKVGDFEELERKEWVPDAHAHRHFKTYDIDAEGDEITGRRLLMWNNDVEISLCRPKDEMDYFFRNGEGDEVVFVHEGAGTLETIFGDVPTRRATTSSSRAGRRTASARGRQRYLVFETPGQIEIPRRYRNQYGQMLEGAPYYHRDIHPPTELNTHATRASSR